MQCRICGNQKNNQEYEAQEMLFGYRDVFLYFQCSMCDCLQIEKFPPDISKYYSDGYYSYKLNSKLNIIERLVKNLRNEYAVFNRGIIGKLLYAKYPAIEYRALAHLPIKKDYNILDVGGGAGIFLHSLRGIGFKNLLGIDPFNEKDFEYGNGLRIQKKNIHEVQGKWDVIMFHHSLEHIHEQEKTLKIAFDLLKPGGYCIIRVPTVSSYAWKHYGMKWVQIDAPRHYYLHSIKSIEILSGKTNFELNNVIYDSTAFQFWGSDQYLKNIPLNDPHSYLRNPKNSLFSKKDISGFSKHAKELNAAKLGDQAVFYLKKLVK
ncbi:MAG: class I SAM-dependent methyltransferase [Ignavibacteriales bacterium]|nr:MAG: class I SAM-dependent methyltransferase [Ignavibacteriales bacterium]